MTKYTYTPTGQDVTNTVWSDNAGVQHFAGWCEQIYANPYGTGATILAAANIAVTITPDPPAPPVKFTPYTYPLTSDTDLSFPIPQGRTLVSIAVNPITSDTTISAAVGGVSLIDPKTYLSGTMSTEGIGYDGSPTADTTVNITHISGTGNVTYTISIG